jgi:hypothetical protein
MTVKQKLLKLINDVEDEHVLESFYQLLKPMHDQTLGDNWASLNSSEKEELLLSYDESFNSNNLVSHSSLIETQTK